MSAIFPIFYSQKQEVEKMRKKRLGIRKVHKLFFFIIFGINLAPV
jgi:hypothetical protein